MTIPHLEPAATSRARQAHHRAQTWQIRNGIARATGTAPCPHCGFCVPHSEDCKACWWVRCLVCGDEAYERTGYCQDHVLGVPLEPGATICPTCDGDGAMDLGEATAEGRDPIYCKQCRGLGHLDDADQNRARERSLR